jgi:hypothetical protein
MAISNIYVRADDGSPVATLDGSFIFRNANDIFVRVSDGATELVTGPSDKWAIYDGARANMARQNWLRSINGVETTAGQFSITGDKCFSWLPGDTAVATFRKNVGLHELPNSKYVLEPRGGGMHMLNMCAACESCATSAQLRQLLESLKIKLNTMKDKNLYSTELVESRKEILHDARLRDLPAACGVYNTSYTPGLETSSRLLGQVATCVHMWNYIAASQLADTSVELSPQDPTAMLIRTRRAMPTCSPSQASATATIQCTVEVSRTTPSVTNDDISVFVPPPVLEFRPFDTQVVHDSDWTLANDANDATHKTLSTTFQAVTAAGTYMLSVYVLPFRCVQVLDQQGNPVTLTAPQVSLQKPAAGQTTDADGKDYRSYTYTGTNATITSIRKTAVTAEDYNQSKVFPSKSVSGKQTWTVNVSWTVTGLMSAGPATFQETFLIEPISPRVPIAELFGNNGMFSQRTSFGLGVAETRPPCGTSCLMSPVLMYFFSIDLRQSAYSAVG